MNDSATIQHGLCSIAVVECLKLRALDSLRATCRNVKHQLDAQDAEVWRSRCLARWALLPRVSMAPLGAFLWQVRLRSQNGWLLGRQSSADAHSPALRSSLVIEGNALRFGSCHKLSSSTSSSSRTRPKRARPNEEQEVLPVVTSMDISSEYVAVLLDGQNLHCRPISAFWHALNTPSIGGHAHSRSGSGSSMIPKPRELTGSNDAGKELENGSSPAITWSSCRLSDAVFLSPRRVMTVGEGTATISSGHIGGRSSKLVQMLSVAVTDLPPPTEEARGGGGGDKSADIESVLRRGLFTDEEAEGWVEQLEENSSSNSTILGWCTRRLEFPLPDPPIALRGVLRPGVSSDASSPSSPSSSSSPYLLHGHVLRLQASFCNSNSPLLLQVDLNHPPLHSSTSSAAAPSSSFSASASSVAPLDSGTEFNWRSGKGSNYVWNGRFTFAPHSTDHPNDAAEHMHAHHRPVAMAVFGSPLGGAGGADDGQELSHTVAIAEQGNPNAGSIVRLYDLREPHNFMASSSNSDASGGGGGGFNQCRPALTFPTGHSMLLNLQTKGTLVLASHAFVDSIEAYDVRRVPQACFTSSLVEATKPPPVVKKWRTGRGTDFALTGGCLAAVSSSWSPGARLKLFFHDIQTTVNSTTTSSLKGRGKPKSLKTEALGDSKSTSQNGTVSSSHEHKSSAFVASRDIPLNAVVMDDFQGRVQGPPRGIAMCDDGACLVYLDRHRLFLQM